MEGLNFALESARYCAWKRRHWAVILQKSVLYEWDWIARTRDHIPCPYSDWSSQQLQSVPNDSQKKSYDLRASVHIVHSNGFLSECSLHHGIKFAMSTRVKYEFLLVITVWMSSSSIPLHSASRAHTHGIPHADADVTCCNTDPSDRQVQRTKAAIYKTLFGDNSHSFNVIQDHSDKNFPNVNCECNRSSAKITDRKLRLRGTDDSCDTQSTDFHDLSTYFWNVDTHSWLLIWWQQSMDAKQHSGNILRTLESSMSLLLSHRHSDTWKTHCISKLHQRTRNSSSICPLTESSYEGGMTSSTDPPWLLWALKYQTPFSASPAWMSPRLSFLQLDAHEHLRFQRSAFRSILRSTPRSSPNSSWNKRPMDNTISSLRHSVRLLTVFTKAKWDTCLRHETSSFLSSQSVLRASSSNKRPTLSACCPVPSREE